MVVQAYAVCIGVTLECRQMESEMIGDGQGCADKADEVYHDRKLMDCLDIWHVYRRDIWASLT